MMYVITKYDRRCIDFHTEEILEACRYRKVIMDEIEDLRCKRSMSDELMKKIYDIQINTQNNYLKDQDDRINKELEEIDHLWNGWHTEGMAKILLKRKG